MILDHWPAGGIDASLEASRSRQRCRQVCCCIEQAYRVNLIATRYRIFERGEARSARWPLRPHYRHLHIQENHVRLLLRRQGYALQAVLASCGDRRLRDGLFFPLFSPQAPPGGLPEEIDRSFVSGLGKMRATPCWSRAWLACPRAGLEGGGGGRGDRRPTVPSPEHVLRFRSGILVRETFTGQRGRQATRRLVPGGEVGRLPLTGRRRFKKRKSAARERRAEQRDRGDLNGLIRARRCPQRDAQATYNAYRTTYNAYRTPPSSCGLVKVRQDAGPRGRRGGA